MNAFQRLLSLPAAEQKRLGVEFTPAEIAQQPSTWAKTAAMLVSRRKAIRSFLRGAGLAGQKQSVLLLTGAGSSEFIGNAVVNVLRQGLGRETWSVPTTHFVTHAASTLVPGQAYVLLSFARSGNSPESVATCALVKKHTRGLKQIIITCNHDGALARAARADRRTLGIELPPETNDRSLVMTSSYSTMAFAAMALTLLNRPDQLLQMAEQAGAGVQRVISAYGGLLAAFGSLPFQRACFLGADTLYGTMQECHLKMQEMTEGRVACRFDSFLGLRHGPQVFVNKECVVVAALSSSPYPRRYELDLLQGLKKNKQGRGMLVICDRATREIRSLGARIVELYPHGKILPDAYRVLTDVVVGQILATFKCMALGLKPDAPCTTGTINRVVKGVKIYPEK